MRIRTGLSGILLVLALGLTGCGGNDSAGATKATPSASAAATSDGVCKLLTPADLEAKFGSAFGDGVSSHQETGADQCLWTTKDATPAKTFSITVLHQNNLDGALKSSGMDVAALFKQAKAAYPKAVSVDLGDEAYASPSEVQVLDGDTWYSFSAFLGTGNAAADILQDLAARVVG